MESQLLKKIKIMLGRSWFWENWHDFVLWSVKHNFSGIENLALIPGSVGASQYKTLELMEWK